MTIATRQALRGTFRRLQSPMQASRAVVAADMATPMISSFASARDMHEYIMIYGTRDAS